MYNMARLLRGGPTRLGQMCRLISSDKRTELGAIVKKRNLSSLADQSSPQESQEIPVQYVQQENPNIPAIQPHAFERTDLLDLRTFNPYLHALIKDLKVLFFCNVHNSLSKRMELELKNYDVDVNVFEVKNGSDMIKATQSFEHDVILCPFLTKMVPDSIWSNSTKPCLIVHPGIPGDRGGSSIDWAIQNGASKWGATVLEASGVWDGGNIWAYRQFPVNASAITKTQMYSGDVTRASTEAALLALVRYKLNLPSRPLNENDPDIKGQFNPVMKKKNRLIDWEKSASQISKIIRSSDTQPGACGQLKGKEYRFYGASGVESISSYAPETNTFPGLVVAKRNGAIMVACGDGNGIWISHMKDPKAENLLKLPATMVFPCDEQLEISDSMHSVYNDVYVEAEDDIVYVHFDFYNGAMSTEQCHRLKQILKNIRESGKNQQAVVLMGGKRFFSTGIHLNVIEAAEKPEIESYRNITGIDDVIKEVFSMEDILTVACLQGNAGAGGVMMAAAADHVIAHRGVMLTPTYRAMHLFGSEYWTYFLPQRVGEDTAIELTGSNDSMLAEQAMEIGLVDSVIGTDRHELLGLLRENIRHLLADGKTKSLLRHKKKERTQEWFETLEQHREEELRRMKECFESEAYHQARKAFVYH